jgi:hypothetical protein
MDTGPLLPVQYGAKHIFYSCDGSLLPELREILLLLIQQYKPQQFKTRKEHFERYIRRFKIDNNLANRYPSQVFERTLSHHLEWHYSKFTNHEKFKRICDRFHDVFRINVGYIDTQTEKLLLSKKNLSSGKDTFRDSKFLCFFNTKVALGGLKGEIPSQVPLIFANVVAISIANLTGSLATAPVFCVKRIDPHFSNFRGKGNNIC